MKNILKLSLAVLSLISIVSCSDDEMDTQKPTVQILTPTNHQEIEPGAVINLKAVLTDNEGLASYKIEIHSGEDGHEHKAKSQDFSYSVVKQVTGNAKTFDVIETIKVPEDAKEEHYHLGITVLDVNGNQNQQFVEIFIGHEHEH